MRLSSIKLTASVAIVLVSSLGVIHSLTMQSGGNSEMNPCLFIGETVICDMNVVQHLASWKSLFAAVSEKINLGAVMMMLIWFSVLGYQILNSLKSASHSLHFRQHSGLRFFSFLKRVFSRGIIQPKIFEEVSI